MTDINEIIKDLINVKNELQKIPSSNDYKKYGSFHPATISRRFGSWNRALIECFGEVIRKRGHAKPIIHCHVCDKETKNPKYCSRSCAAKINNSLFPKNPKRPRHKCPNCQSFTTSKAKLCRKCNSFIDLQNFGEKTIEDFSSTYARHKYQGIRHHAHRVAKYYNIKKECPFCDYKNHTQLCHIKDIGKFDKTTKIKVVNDLKNLIYLCPNHHWDLDHDLLKL